MTQTWNVLCPGPSLSKLLERPDGHVVAVNSAIRHDAEADIFCGLDTPLSFGAAAGPEEKPLIDVLRRRTPRMWVDPIAFEDWRKWGFANVQGWEWRNHGLVWLPALLHRTVFYAILGCLMHGAKVIDLWGCDMEGDSYFDGPGSNWGSDRWIREKLCLDKIVVAAKTKGIRIARR